MRKSHPWRQEKTQWGEFVQRNKILSMVFGLANQQQCWETPGIRENSFSERMERLARDSDGISIPGRVHKPSGCGTWGHSGDIVAVLVFCDLFHGFFSNPNDPKTPEMGTFPVSAAQTQPAGSDGISHLVSPSQEIF